VNPFSSLATLVVGETVKPQHALLDKKNDVLPAINPYHILQVRRDATKSEIRKSYRRLALLNHPGRSHDNEEQRKRRLQLFEILAASYETLMDKEARRRFDLHLSVVENLRLKRGLAGEMFVGGRRLGHEIVPVLISSSSSCSSCSSTSSITSHEDSEIHLTPSTTNMLAVIATDGSHTGRTDSVSSSEREFHFSSTETDRLFGGPLTNLYRARNFEPFSDSLTIFEQELVTQVFHVSKEEVGLLKEWEPIRSLTSPSGWEGSSKTSKDGKTTVFTTSRILYDRRVTRIETIVDDPITGERRNQTTVSSEALDSGITDEEVGLVKCFGLCGGGGDKYGSSASIEKSSGCGGDILQTYRDIWAQFIEDLRRNGPWNRINQ